MAKMAEAVPGQSEAGAGSVGPELVELGNAAQLTDIASRYYERGLTQSQIGRALGLDASTVSRQLKRAREEGIVRIEIRPPRRRLVDLGLGRAVAEQFGIARAVVRSDRSPATLHEVAGEYFGSLLRSGMQIGVASWSTTLAEVVRCLEPGAVSELVISQLAGGLSDPTPEGQRRELLTLVASLYPRSAVHYLHAPLLLDSAEVRDALLADSSVRAALTAASQCELALVGIGQIGPDATVFRANVVNSEDRAALLKAGVVGSFCGHFFDRLGSPAGHLDGRTIALEWSQLRRIRTTVAVAAGASKLEAICGALRTGCIKVLVTDYETAAGLLDCVDRTDMRPTHLEG